MIKRKIESVEYVLEKKDIELVKKALQYTRHRITVHKKPHSGFIVLKEVDRLLEQFTNDFVLDDF